MKEDVSGSKFPMSVADVDVAFVPVDVVLVMAVELVGGLVLVPLFDCASAPRTVKDRLATSKSRNRLFLKVNKFWFAKTNTHNLYDSC